LSSDGKYFASGGFDSLVKLWSVESLMEVKIFRGHKNAVACITFSPDG
jgi:ribosomal RNA-processing protein 9